MKMRIADCGLRIVGGIAVILYAIALPLFSQEAPLPRPTDSPITEIASPAATASATIPPTATPTLTPVPTPSSAVSPPPPSTRNVRVSFLPPPLEGKISLGIYDKGNQLVRVLHQESDVEDFTVGDDGLLTKWDGRNDGGQDVPPGKYRARGYVVAPMSVEELGAAGSFTESPGPARIKLITNPLEKNDRPVIDLKAGFDDKHAFLKTADGLPLVTITSATGSKRASITDATDKSVGVMIDSGSAIRAFQISGLSKMMAFDCGDLEVR